MLNKKLVLLTSVIVIVSIMLAIAYILPRQHHNVLVKKTTSAVVPQEGITYRVVSIRDDTILLSVGNLNQYTGAVGSIIETSIFPLREFSIFSLREFLGRKLWSCEVGDIITFERLPDGKIIIGWG